MNTFDKTIRHVKVPHRPTWHIVQYSSYISIQLDLGKKNTLGLEVKYLSSNIVSYRTSLGLVLPITLALGLMLFGETENDTLNLTLN